MSLFRGPLRLWQHFAWQSLIWHWIVYSPCWHFLWPFLHLFCSLILNIARLSVHPLFNFCFPSSSLSIALPLTLQLNEKRKKSHHCEGAHMHYCHHKGAIIWVSSVLLCIRENSCSIVLSLSAKQMTHSSPLRFTPTEISSILRKFTEESDEISYLMFCKVHLRLICLHWNTTSGITNDIADVYVTPSRVWHHLMGATKYFMSEFTRRTL